MKSRSGKHGDRLYFLSFRHADAGPTPRQAAQCAPRAVRRRQEHRTAIIEVRAATHRSIISPWSSGFSPTSFCGDRSAFQAGPRHFSSFSCTRPKGRPLHSTSRFCTAGIRSPAAPSSRKHSLTHRVRAERAILDSTKWRLGWHPNVEVVRVLVGGTSQPIGAS